MVDPEVRESDNIARNAFLPIKKQPIDGVPPNKLLTAKEAWLAVRRRQQTFVLWQ